MSEFIQTARSLSRSPWYTLAIVAVLAVSIAASISTFLFADGVLFRPLPYDKPDELFVPRGLRRAVSVREARAWREVFTVGQVALHQQPFITGRILGRVSRDVSAAAIDEYFLTVLGVSPRVGSLERSDFLSPGVPVPVLISDRFWHAQFGASPAVLGTVFSVAGSLDRAGHRIPSFRVAGVLPPDFIFPSGGSVPDLLYPLVGNAQQEASRNWASAALLVRVPGALPSSIAESQLAAAVRGPQDDSLELRFVPLGEAMAAPHLTYARAVLSAGAVLTLLGFLGFCGLLLARHHERAREDQTRVSLGASRLDLLRLRALEAGLLVTVGTLAGLVLSYLLLNTLDPLIPAGPPRASVGLGARGLAYCAFVSACAIGIGTLTGLLVPGRRRTGRRRLWHTLAGPDSVIVAGLLAASFVATVAGVLMVDSLVRIWQREVGFEASDVLLIELDLTPIPPGGRMPVRDQVLQFLHAEGAVTTAAIETWFLHPRGALLSPAIRRPAESLPGDEHAVPFSGELFDTLGIDVLAGRLPSREELRTFAPVVVVSRKAAARLWPGKQPVGKVLMSANGKRVETVVGVVEDASYGGIGRESDGQIYRAGAAWNQPAIVARMPHGRTLNVKQLVARVEGISPGVAVTRFESLRSALGHSVKSRTFRAWLFGAFAVAALLVSGIGIFGAAAMSMAGRRQEIAVRYALGCSRRKLVTDVVRARIPSIVTGLAGGALAASWVVKLLRAFLSDGGVYDVRAWLTAAAALLCIALIGLLVPAWRASRVEPSVALKLDSVIGRP